MPGLPASSINPGAVIGPIIAIMVLIGLVYGYVIWKRRAKTVGKLVSASDSSTISITDFGTHVSNSATETEKKLSSDISITIDNPAFDGVNQNSSLARRPSQAVAYSKEGRAALIAAKSNRSVGVPLPIAIVEVAIVIATGEVGSLTPHQLSMASFLPLLLSLSADVAAAAIGKILKPIPIRPIDISDLAPIIKKMLLKTKQGFLDEYLLLEEYETQLPTTLACNPKFVIKNRYKNILPFDHSIVLLQEDADDPKSCYINASYISGYNNKLHHYIAAQGTNFYLIYYVPFAGALTNFCQGPKLETLSDWWRMIWEQRVPVILMGIQYISPNKEP